MKRFIGNLLVAAVAIAVISFFAAPGVAFFAIRSAAEADDVAGLARLIDFGAVRQSLRPQMSGRAEAMAPAPSFLEDPIGAVRRQLEQNPVAGAPDVDAYLTPPAIAALTRAEGRLASQRSSGPQVAAEDPAGTGPLPRPRFWGVNRSRMAVVDDGGSETVFTFERKGPFEWKLVHIGLPDGVSPAVAPAPGQPAAKAG